MGQGAGPVYKKSVVSIQYAPVPVNRGAGEGFALCPSSAAGAFRLDARREGSVGPPEAPVGVAEGLCNDYEPR